MNDDPIRRPDDPPDTSTAGPGRAAPGDAPGPEGTPADAEARLAELRTRLEEIDEELIRLVGRRRDLVLEVGSVKEALGRPVLDPTREAHVVRRAAERARALGVDEELVRDVVWRIMASAREAQTGRSAWGPPDPPGPDTGQPDEDDPARSSG
ncbi:MAG TPA: chorismate mutase [Longimicrobiales bacterium]|nr:chorismate mutase [Longimicrobiales bacterium]